MSEEKRLTVLHVEDGLVYAELIKKELGKHMDVIHVTSIEGAHQVGEADVVLLDLNLEATLGVDTLRVFRHGCPHLPVVVLTGVEDANIEALCMEAGANSYYRKGTFDLSALVKSIEAAVISWQHRGKLETHRKSFQEIRELLTVIMSRIETLTDPSKPTAGASDSDHS